MTAINKEKAFKECVLLLINLGIFRRIEPLGRKKYTEAVWKLVCTLQLGFK